MPSLSCLSGSILLMSVICWISSGSLSSSSLLAGSRLLTLRLRHTLAKCLILWQLLHFTVLRGICVVGANFFVHRIHSCCFLLSFRCFSGSFVCLVVIFFVLVPLLFLSLLRALGGLLIVYVSCRNCLGLLNPRWFSSSVFFLGSVFPVISCP